VKRPPGWMTGETSPWLTWLVLMVGGWILKYFVRGICKYL